MGFASGTLLVFVSLYVLFEGFEHILEPHEVNTYVHDSTRAGRCYEV
jgi:Co/Zn/Cd efflux system component